MAITPAVMQKISNFELAIDGDQWNSKYLRYAPKSLTKERKLDLANHLWGKFHGFNHSIIRLWGSLDIQNRKIIAKMVNSGAR